MKPTALKAYFHDKKIPISSLARKCGISKNYLSNILSGQRSNPSIPMIIRLATELDLPVLTIREFLETPYEYSLEQKGLIDTSDKEFLVYCMLMVCLF
jgi:transcriptional regulator with XRE-family HTH domain